MAKFEMFACFQDKMVLQRESDVKSGDLQMMERL